MPFLSSVLGGYAGSDAFDAVVPVPLHWMRRFWRGFNQADLLAKSFCQAQGLKYAPLILKRIRHTPSQGMKKRKQRQENVKHAFQLSDAHKKSIQGKHILLVDDVLTTGATLNACAAELLKGGAKRVSAVTLARVF